MRQEKPETIQRVHLELDKFDYYVVRSILLSERKTFVSWVKEKMSEVIAKRDAETNAR